MPLPNLPPEWPALSSADETAVRHARRLVGNMLTEGVGHGWRTRRGILLALADQHGNDDIQTGLEGMVSDVKNAFGQRWMELNPGAGEEG